MTALIQEHARSFERWDYHLFTLAAGTKAWKGGLAALEVGTGKVKPAAGTGTLLVIGTFNETVDAAGGDTPVNVKLNQEIEIEWLAGTGFAATDVGKPAYVLDDQTVQLAGTVLAGRIWAVDAVNGIGVQLVSLAPTPTAPAVEEPAPEEEPPVEPPLEDEEV